MKRVLLAISGTVAGIVALLSFKTHSLATSGPGLQPAALGPAPQGSGPSPHRHRQPTSHRTSGPKPANHHSATGASKRVTGPAVQTPYGVVQVVLTVSGSHIDHVGLARLTAFDPTSQEINSQAAPILVHETMAAQSSRINMVSGATYTSEGYLQSLQRALNDAGLH